MEVGKVYEFKNGVLKRENGTFSGSVYFSKENFESRNRNIKIELVTDLSQPHKSLLKSGMEVVFRDGIHRYVLIETDSLYHTQGALSMTLKSYHENLICSTFSSLDVMEIWDGDTLIAKRTEKSTQEIEIERIESEMRKLSEAQNKLADGLKKIKQL
jgi:hypothetical protein